MEAIEAGRLPRAPMAALLGLRLEHVERGHTVLSVEPGEQHENEVGLIHGGLASALLDHAMGATLATTLAAGDRAAGLELSVRFGGSCARTPAACGPRAGSSTPAGGSSTPKPRFARRTASCSPALPARSRCSAARWRIGEPPRTRAAGAGRGSAHSRYLIPLLMGPVIYMFTQAIVIPTIVPVSASMHISRLDGTWVLTSFPPQPAPS